MTTNRVSGRVLATIWGVTMNTKLVYCWKGSSDPTQGVSGISDSELIEELGLINVTENGLGGKIGVMGANSPKPPRLSKRGTNGESVTTFCSPLKYRSALSKGYSIASRGRSRGVLDSAQKESAAVEIYGLIYCWSAYGTLFTAGGGELATLCGISRADTLVSSQSEVERVVFGTSRPRPAEAKFQIQSGAGSTSKPILSLFISEEAEANESVIIAAKSIRPSVPSL